MVAQGTFDFDQARALADAGEQDESCVIQLGSVLCPIFTSSGMSSRIRFGHRGATQQTAMRVEATFTGGTFTENQVQGGPSTDGRGPVGGGDSNGGALVIAGGDTLISQCAFAANHADGPVGYGNSSGRANGGALFISDGKIQLVASYFTLNTATGGKSAAFGADSQRASDGNGGAVLIDRGNLEIRESTFYQNDASGGPGYGRGSFGVPPAGYGGDARGGAVCCRGGNTTFVNCTLTENSVNGGQGSGHSQALGGAIEGAATLINVTIANNSAQAGRNLDRTPPAPPVQVASISGTFQVANTILSAAPATINAAGVITDNGHNICSDQSAAFGSASSRNSVDPRLAPLASNGGFTPTMALLPGSPAIDAANDAVCPFTDQRGAPRPIGPACDIGAFEFGPEG